jgi:hypothetical protein
MVSLEGAGSRDKTSYFLVDGQLNFEIYFFHLLIIIVSEAQNLNAAEI